MNSYFDDIQMNRINFKSVDVEVTERNWKKQKQFMLQSTCQNIFSV